MSQFPQRPFRFVGLLLVHFVVSETARAQIDKPRDVPGELAKIAERYEIEISTAELTFPSNTSYGVIDGKNAEPKELASYFNLFATEFTLYPPSFVKRSRLKRIVLCDQLAFAGQRRNAIPDVEHDTLYLDVRRGSYNKLYLCKVIHHEFFHIIDYRDDGSLYRDERWSALNPSNFKYGSGGKNAQDVPTTSLLTDTLPGFLNHYSTTSVEEDKAELFANLIVAPAHVENRAKHDIVLKAKVEHLRRAMNGFCSDMNEEFWEKVKHAKRPKN